MPAIPGTIPLTGQVAPTDSTDTFPTHEDIYGAGGYMTVADATARNAITTERRKKGMLVYLVSDGLVYQLNTTTNTGTSADWTVVSLSGSSVYVKGAGWDGGGTSGAIVAASANVVRGRAQAAGTILSAYAVGNTSGSLTVEVWKKAASPPSSVDKISGSSPITLASQWDSLDTTLSGWTTSVAVGDRFAFKILTASGLTWAEVELLIG